MNARSAVGTGLLLIAAVSSWYLAHSLQGDEVEESQAQIMQNGFYLKSARILGTSDGGRLLYEIEAQSARQQDDGEVEFQDVVINYTTEAKVPWTLKADTARIGNDRDYVTLSGHVIATSNEGFSGDVTEIRTQYLELQPDSFRAQTDERVQIRIGTRSLTAVGMLSLLQTNQLQLKSNVSGKFVP